jgi:hypothetical protein
MEVTVFGIKILSQEFEHFYGKGTLKEITRPFIRMNKIA